MKSCLKLFMFNVFSFLPSSLKLPFSREDLTGPVAHLCFLLTFILHFEFMSSFILSCSSKTQISKSLTLYVNVFVLCFIFKWENNMLYVCDMISVADDIFFIIQTVR